MDLQRPADHRDPAAHQEGRPPPPPAVDLRRSADHRDPAAHQEGRRVEGTQHVREVVHDGEDHRGEEHRGIRQVEEKNN